VQLLQQKGYTVVRSREPGGTPLAEKLRSLIIHESMDPLAELFLFFACRADNVEKIIKPAIARGEVVVFDRFVDSSIVFQGYGRGLLEQAYKLKELLFERSKIRIDHTLYFDIPMEESFRRLAHRSGEDRFEKEVADFKARIFHGYQEVMDEVEHRVTRIDAGGSIDEVKALVEEWVEKFVQEHPLMEK